MLLSNCFEAKQGCRTSKRHGQPAAPQELDQEPRETKLTSPPIAAASVEAASEAGEGKAEAEKVRECLHFSSVSCFREDSTAMEQRK